MFSTHDAVSTTTYITAFAELQVHPSRCWEMGLDNMCMAVTLLLHCRRSQNVTKCSTCSDNSLKLKYLQNAIPMSR
jgi:hypothetical protein